jgi:hypothetical protein
VLLFKLRSEDAQARFWLRVLGINFAIGVVTGIPMEFQFGTKDCAAGDLSTAAREAVGLDETEESLDDLGVQGRPEGGAEQHANRGCCAHENRDHQHHLRNATHEAVRHCARSDGRPAGRRAVGRKPWRLSVLVNIVVCG